MVLYDGQNLNYNNNKITNFSFSKSDFGLGNMESHLVVHKKIKEQSTKLLIECAISLYLKQNKKILNCNQDTPRETYKELFERLIVPLYLPLLILISSINLLITKENIHYLKLRLSIFMLGIFTIIISESSIGFIENLFYKNIIFILFPIVFFFIIYSILIIKFKINFLQNSK